MNYNIIIALVGALINIMLAVTVPCVVRKSKEPLMNDIKKLYRAKRELILSSSIIIGITIYLALELTPEIRSLYDNFSGNSYSNQSDMLLNDILSGYSRPNLRNLIRLN